MSTQTKRRLLRVLGYVGFFLGCYVVALAVTFPYDRLTGFAERRVGEALGREVTIGSVRLTLTGRIRLDDVRLGPSTTEPSDDADPGRPVLVVDRTTVRIGLLALALGGLDLAFEGDVADGAVTGRYRRDDEGTVLKAKLVGLDARRLPALRDKIGLPIKGSIAGELDATVPAGKANESTGSIRLALKGFVIGDGESRLSVSRLMGFGAGRPQQETEEEGIALPPMSLGPVAVQTPIANGEAKIPRVEARSDDVEVTFEGSVKLREPLGQSRVETYLTFKLTDAYTERDDEVRGIMKLVNVAGRDARRPDGSFGFRLSGTLGGGVALLPAKTYAGESGRARPGGLGAGRRRPGGVVPRPLLGRRRRLRRLHPPGGLRLVARPRA